jgi:hypothetical protein
MSFYNRYGTKIYGLTGTVGGPKVQNMLNKAYNVDCMRIPRLREEQYFSLPRIKSSS